MEVVNTGEIKRTSVYPLQSKGEQLKEGLKPYEDKG